MAAEQGNRERRDDFLLRCRRYDGDMFNLARQKDANTSRSQNDNPCYQDDTE